MEKKVYLKPAVTVVKLDNVQLMAASDPNVLQMDIEREIVNEIEIG